MHNKMGQNVQTASSTPLGSTKRVLHEHLLFSRRLRRDGVVLVPTMRKSGQGFKPWPPFFRISHIL